MINWIVITLSGLWHGGLILIPVAVSESEAKCLEASDVTGQFEYSEDSQNAEYLSRLRHPLERILGV